MRRCLILAILSLCVSSDFAFAEKFDILIRGGRIVDGTGAPWRYGDVGIRDGMVARMGRLNDAEAERIIDAKGLIVAPGFIDMMGQTATPFLDDQRAGFNLITQGITTINCGEGVSAAPSLGRDRWKSMAEYFALLEKSGMPINAVQTVGHTQIRLAVLGDADRQPTAEQLDAMRAHVREAMQAGAIGVSTALIYPPAVYAKTPEIVELVKVAGEYGGGYFTHMRNEGDQLLEAIDEALQIGKEAKAPVHIFHLKTAGRQNWGKMDLALARIKAARAEGRQVAADVYPYINNGLGIEAIIHPRHAAEGTAGLRQKLKDPAARAEIRNDIEHREGWENWYRHAGNTWDNIVLSGMTKAPFSDHNGKSLAQVAKATGKDPWDAFFEITLAGAFALPQTMSEANKMRAMREEFVSFDTDVGPLRFGQPATHPRAYGAFPRVVARYVRELGVMSLERAVAQMTSVAANELFLHDRGRLAPGLPADIVVFDFATIRDHATLGEPSLPSQGVHFLIVNGKLVLDEGKPTNARPGKVLRGPGANSAPNTN